MLKATAKQIAEKREEIIIACEKLYQTKSFKDITLKDIAEATSFSRPTIYNYFETKEEIFLALYELEYKKWNKELNEILIKNEVLTKHELADKIAKSLEKREQLLKLLSMNNYDMEVNSREELLKSFKEAYGESLHNMNALLEKFCLDIKEDEREKVIYIFYPFMFGIYPYTKVTSKQKKAMKDAGVNYKYQSIYSLIYNCLMQLLTN